MHTSNDLNVEKIEFKFTNTQTNLTSKIAMVHQLHDVYFYVDFCNCFNFMA